MTDKKVNIKKTADKTAAKQEQSFVFGKENYMLMAIGVAIIILGFCLMYGKEDIFDFRKVTLAPIVVLSGFVIGIFAIMKKAKD